MQQGADAATPFAFFARGERVPGHLFLPQQSGAPAPLLLAPAGGEPGLGQELDAAARHWAGRGAAVGRFDLPLCGERRSPKLSQLLAGALAAGSGSGAALLLEEFVRQSLAELGHALDALLSRPEIDAGRCALVAFGLGGQLAALWCGGEPRLCAAALGLGAAPPGLAALDAQRALLRFAPRPLLELREPPLRAAAAVAEFFSRRWDATGPQPGAAAGVHSQRSKSGGPA